MVGLGIDLVRISRVRGELARDARGLESTLLTDRERTSSLGLEAGAALAARIAAKEAVLKALGCGIVDLRSWREVEVTGSVGSLAVELHDRARANLCALGGRRVLLASCLAGDWAMVGAVLEA